VEPESAGDECEEFQALPELVNPALEWLADMDEEEFRRTFKSSPVRRGKRADCGGMQ